MEKIIKEVSLVTTTGKTSNGDIVTIPDISVSYNFKLFFWSKIRDLGVFDDIVTGVTSSTTTTLEPISTTTTTVDGSTTTTTTSSTTTTTEEPTTTVPIKTPVTIELINISPQLGKWRATFNGVSSGVLELEGAGTSGLTLALLSSSVSVVVEKISPNSVTDDTTEISFLLNDSFPIQKVENINPSVDTSINPATHTFTNIGANDKLTVKIDLLT